MRGDRDQERNRETLQEQRSETSNHCESRGSDGAIESTSQEESPNVAIVRDWLRKAEGSLVRMTPTTQEKGPDQSNLKFLELEERLAANGMGIDSDCED